jgi:hypothetical protein
MAGRVFVTVASAGQGQLAASVNEWSQSKCSVAEYVLIEPAMGTATALIEAGAENALGVMGSAPFGAYITLSHRRAMDHSFLKMHGPVVNPPQGCKWMGVIDGPLHMDFSVHWMSRRSEALNRAAIGAIEKSQARVVVSIFRRSDKNC